MLESSVNLSPSGASVHPTVARILAAERVIGVLSTLLGRISLVVMFVIIATEVVFREGLGQSTHLSDELGGYLLAALAFLGLPMTLQHNGFNRAEFLTGVLPERLTRAIDIAFNIICLAFALVVTVELAKLVHFSYLGGELSLTQLRIPLWIPQLPMAVGMAGLTIAQALQTWRIAVFAHPIHMPKSEEY